MSAYLDPQPFRDWYREKKAHFETEEIARWFGVGPRTLRRWDEESAHIRRGEFEDAVMRSQFSLWDIYPDLEDEPVSEKEEPQEARPASPRAFLSDAQLHALHRLHTERRITVHRLGGEVSEQLGFSNRTAARNAIRRGFRRLGLPLVRFEDGGSLARRCRSFTHRGHECQAAPLWGSDYCRAHHPDTRAEVRSHALSISPFVKAAA